MFVCEMPSLSQLSGYGRSLQPHRLARLADQLAAAVAISLPWSITASGILVAIWLIVFLSTVDFSVLRRAHILPAVAMPVALCVLGAIGMMWAVDVPWADRLTAFKPFLRLPIIGLLIVQFQKSDRGTWVLRGFLASCIVLMALSWIQWLIPTLSWRSEVPFPGIPVKDYIVQGGEFLICAFALGHLSFNAWCNGRRLLSIGFTLLAMSFIANIAFVATARSALPIFVALVILFGFQRFYWKGNVVVLLLMALFSAAVWNLSPHLRARVHSVMEEIREYRDRHGVSSAGYRLEFWSRSVEIISRAPIIGHGTGSVYEQFRQTAKGHRGIAGAVTDNPHNQTLLVACQLGFIGVALLYAMWLAHLMLFRGNTLAAQLGCGLIVHSIGACLFNSQLFEATLGWIYIFGVGVLGGILLREKSARAKEPG